MEWDASYKPKNKANDTEGKCVFTKVDMRVGWFDTAMQDFSWFSQTHKRDNNSALFSKPVDIKCIVIFLLTSGVYFKL